MKNLIVPVLASGVVRRVVIGTLRVATRSTDNELDGHVVELVDALWARDWKRVEEEWYNVAEYLIAKKKERVDAGRD